MQENGKDIQNAILIKVSYPEFINNFFKLIMKKNPMEKLWRNLTRHFSKKGILTVNKHRKRWSTSWSTSSSPNRPRLLSRVRYHHWPFPQGGSLWGLSHIPWTCLSPSDHKLSIKRNHFTHVCIHQNTWYRA